MEAPAENTTPNPKAAYMHPVKSDAVINPISNAEAYADALAEAEAADTQPTEKKKRTRKS